MHPEIIMNIYGWKWQREICIDLVFFLQRSINMEDIIIIAAARLFNVIKT